MGEYWSEAAYAELPSLCFMVFPQSIITVKRKIALLDHSSSEYLHKDASAKLEFTKSVNCLRVRYEAYD